MSEAGMSRWDFLRESGKSLAETGLAIWDGWFDRARLDRVNDLWSGPWMRAAAASRLGARPTLALAGGRPLYLWKEGEEVLAVEAACPRDGGFLQWRSGPGAPGWHCSGCDGRFALSDLDREKGVLQRVPVRVQDGWVRCRVQ